MIQDDDSWGDFKIRQTLVSNLEFMAQNRTPEVGKLQYKFDPNEEYVFYPAPLSRQGSYDTLFPKKSAVIEVKDEKPLNNPNIRTNLAKLKPHKPWFLGTVTIIQVLMLIMSMYFNWSNTGSFIQTEPFNLMIGPNPGVFYINKTLILMGARYLPCIKPGSGYDKPGGYFECPSGIKGTSKFGMCSFEDICTLGGKSLGLSNAVPNQWYRFFSPILLHSGVVHLLLNLSFQVQGGFDLEKVYKN
jgi:membrane associated rhomboid family serine protease